MADYEAVRQALAHPPTGFTMGKIDIRPAATPDFRFAVTRERGGSLVLSGNVVSETAREEIRAMSGNLDFRAFAAREDEESITVIHEWVDEPSFAAYLSSAAFARSGTVLRPMVTAPPVSRRFHADLLETV